ISNSGSLRGSNNLVEDGSGLPGWLSGDPGLGELKDNGGPTWTHALLPGSRAIDAGDNTLVPSGGSTDQRGRDRFVNGVTDLGALEDGEDAPRAADDAFTTREDTPLTVAAPGLLANDSDPNGDTLEAALETGPAHGVVQVGADGSFVYTP